MSTRVTTADPLDLPFAEATVVVGGRAFKFRELSVKENDECADASRGENGTIDGRVMMRLMVAKSSVDPKITVERLASMPQRAYSTLADTVNDLHAAPFPEETEPKND